MAGVNAHRPVIVVPRLVKYHEHVDDHQQQIAEAFAEKKMVIYCKDVDMLRQCIDEAKNFHFEPYDVKGGKVEDIVLNFMNLFD